MQEKEPKLSVLILRAVITIVIVMAVLITAAILVIVLI